ncbi:MAG: DNA recombination protein RmuC [Bacteriovoracaceae bacterium]
MTLKDEFRQNREENNKVSKDNREELNNTLKDFKKELSDTLKLITEINNNNAKASTDNNNILKDEVKKSFKEFGDSFEKSIASFNNIQKEKFEQMDKKQSELLKSTETKLDLMRETVDEKLQKTLNERLGQSFETVGKQLQAVQEGLGEMKTLAQDVGGLKKVLGNVKMRGGIGEVQLAMLLEQILAPGQYESNVKTKKGSSDLVEFAIKLPGKEEGLDQIWIPVDAKFPKDIYEQLQLAHDTNDLVQIELAQRNLENTIKKMAKDISEKYIDPPNTTDFAIMFLPFEGIFAEVVRKASLFEELQKNYKVIVTGPTTFAAILNSLHMGFRTLAIQKRSSEVWTVLGAVKTEFDKFGGLLDKVQKNIQLGLDDLDKLAGTRTKAINRKLKSIDALTDVETKLVLPELGYLDEDEAE